MGFRHTKSPSRSRAAAPPSESRRVIQQAGSLLFPGVRTRRCSSGCSVVALSRGPVRTSRTSSASNSLTEGALPSASVCKHIALAHLTNGFFAGFRLGAPVAGASVTQPSAPSRTARTRRRTAAAPPSAVTAGRSSTSSCSPGSNLLIRPLSFASVSRSSVRATLRAQLANSCRHSPSWVLLVPRPLGSPTRKACAPLSGSTPWPGRDRTSSPSCASLNSSAPAAAWSSKRPSTVQPLRRSAARSSCSTCSAALFAACACFLATTSAAVLHFRSIDISPEVSFTKVCFASNMWERLAHLSASCASAFCVMSARASAKAAMASSARLRASCSLLRLSSCDWAAALNSDPDFTPSSKF
mmetsp:Transcript_12664/g.35585  ORF Transcript_12664/g.35585 Transcript_12664/m.35585 type:complete len:356 (-) Transcript_12664:3228-4295(-)